MIAAISSVYPGAIIIIASTECSNASAGEIIGICDAGAYFPCLNGAESIIYSIFFVSFAVAASVNP